MLKTLALAAVISLGGAAAVHAKPMKGDDLTCLALTIYWEARGEPEAGQRAVGHVLLNRAGHEDFPSTICAVMKQNLTGVPGECQFSFWCDGRGDRPRDRDAWLKARAIAKDIIDNPDADPTHGALYFHEKSVKPSWRAHYKVVARIGRHVFYAPTESDATRSAQRDQKRNTPS